MRYLVKYRFSDISPMLKYETPSWFYGDKRVDYGTCEVSVCPRTPPRGMLQWPFHYDNSSMYAAVGDMNYIAESIVLGKSTYASRCRKGGLAQYADDVQLATQWRFRSLTSIYGR